MPAPGQRPTGAPVWDDLSTSDLDGAVAFYTALFGWEHTDYGEEYAHYGVFTKDGADVVGVAPRASADAPVRWGVYLLAPNVGEATDTALNAGATVLVPPVDIPPGRGRTSMIADRGGAVVSLWQPGTMTGFGVVDEPGATLWHELLTPDYDGSLDFYREVVGWETRVVADSRHMRYSTLTVGGTDYAGVWDASTAPTDQKVRGARWTVVFQVDDVDTTAAKAASLGGRVVDEPRDSEYGRFAGLRDPQGAEFSIMTPPLVEAERDLRA